MNKHKDYQAIYNIMRNQPIDDLKQTYSFYYQSEPAPLDIDKEDGELIDWAAEVVRTMIYSDVAFECETDEEIDNLVNQLMSWYETP